MILLFYMLITKNCVTISVCGLTPNKRMVFLYGVYVRKDNDRTPGVTTEPVVDLQHNGIILDPL